MSDGFEAKGASLERAAEGPSPLMMRPLGLIRPWTISAEGKVLVCTTKAGCGSGDLHMKAGERVCTQARRASIP